MIRVSICIDLARYSGNNGVVMCKLRQSEIPPATNERLRGCQQARMKILGVVSVRRISEGLT